MDKPSEAYFRRLKEAKDHHLASKTFSGSLLRPHAPFIKEIIDRKRCKTVLDYGCGKGVQYEWWMPLHQCTIEDYWGVRVRKYDPAWQEFSEEPTEQHDLVICTHTLGAIPVSDLSYVVNRLHSLAGKAIYIAEKVGWPPKKKVFSDPELTPLGWTAEKWLAVIHRHNPIEVTVAIKRREGNAVYTKHYRSSGGDWEEVVWPKHTVSLNHTWA